MSAFLVDQNFNEHIVDGLTRRDPTLEFTHVRDMGMAAAPDPMILDETSLGLTSVLGGVDPRRDDAAPDRPAGSERDTTVSEEVEGRPHD